MPDKEKIVGDILRFQQDLRQSQVQKAPPDRPVRRFQTGSYTLLLEMLLFQRIIRAQNAQALLLEMLLVYRIVRAQNAQALLLEMLWTERNHRNGVYDP